MKSIVGGIAIVILCCAILAVMIIAGQFELHELGLAISGGIGVLVYYVTRWMRGPGSELGTPVPSLNLSEHELDDESS